MMHFYHMQPSEFSQLPEEAIEGLAAWMQEQLSQRG